MKVYTAYIGTVQEGTILEARPLYYTDHYAARGALLTQMVDGDTSIYATEDGDRLESGDYQGTIWSCEVEAGSDLGVAADLWVLYEWTPDDGSLVRAFEQRSAAFAAAEVEAGSFEMTRDSWYSATVELPGDDEGYTHVIACGIG